jgi:hypothetical protein
MGRKVGPHHLKISVANCPEMILKRSSPLSAQFTDRLAIPEYPGKGKRGPPQTIPQVPLCPGSGKRAYNQGLVDPDRQMECSRSFHVAVVKGSGLKLPVDIGPPFEQKPHGNSVPLQHSNMQRGQAILIHMVYQARMVLDEAGYDSR